MKFILCLWLDIVESKKGLALFVVCLQENLFPFNKIIDKGDSSLLIMMSLVVIMIMMLKIMVIIMVIATVILIKSMMIKMIRIMIIVITMIR